MAEQAMLSLVPVVSVPERARVSTQYLMSIDLRHDVPAHLWPSGSEELEVTCILETRPLFSHQSLGSDRIIVHRFGGSYGPAKFLLTACDEEATGSISVLFVDARGVPVHRAQVSNLTVREGDAPSKRVSLPVGITRVGARKSSSKSQAAASRPRPKRAPSSARRRSEASPLASSEATRTPANTPAHPPRASQTRSTTERDVVKQTPPPPPRRTARRTAPTPDTKPIPPPPKRSAPAPDAGKITPPPPPRRSAPTPPARDTDPSSPLRRIAATNDAKQARPSPPPRRSAPTPDAGKLRLPPLPPNRLLEEAPPRPRDDDDDDVAWALQTARTQWQRQRFADAIMWVRRAADTAKEMGATDRALQLARAAARLSGQVKRDHTTSSAPPTAAPAKEARTAPQTGESAPQRKRHAPSKMPEPHRELNPVQRREVPPPPGRRATRQAPAKPMQPSEPGASQAPTAAGRADGGYAFGHLSMVDPDADALRRGDKLADEGLIMQAVDAYCEGAEHFARTGLLLKATAVYRAVRQLIAERAPEARARSLNIAPQLAELYVQLGLTSDALLVYDEVASQQTRLGRHAPAISARQRMVQVDPTEPQHHINLGEALYANLRTDEALEALRAGLDLLLERGDRGAVFPVIERMLQWRTDPELAKLAAHLYLQEGTRRACFHALEKLRICYGANKEDPETLQALIQTFTLMGDSAKAEVVRNELARLQQAGRALWPPNPTTLRSPTESKSAEREPVQNRSAESKPVEGKPLEAPPRRRVVTSGLMVKFESRVVSVDKSRFVIGRGTQTCDLTIRDPNVSRQHAMVEEHDGAYYMADMGSTNGVLFQGKRIERQLIRNGDTFRICGHELTFSGRTEDLPLAQAHELLEAALQSADDLCKKARFGEAATLLRAQAGNLLHLTGVRPDHPRLREHVLEALVQQDWDDQGGIVDRPGLSTPKRTASPDNLPSSPRSSHTNDKPAQASDPELDEFDRAFDELFGDK